MASGIFGYRALFIIDYLIFHTRFTFIRTRVNLSNTLYKYKPITSSAKKAIRAGKHKRVFNLRAKSAIDKNIKALRALIAKKDKVGAAKLIPSIYKSLDKAAKTGFIKDNAASRLKGRAMAALKRLG